MMRWRARASSARVRGDGLLLTSFAAAEARPRVAARAAADFPALDVSVARGGPCRFQRRPGRHRPDRGGDVSRAPEAQHSPVSRVARPHREEARSQWLQQRARVHVGARAASRLARALPIESGRLRALCRGHLVSPLDPAQAPVQHRVVVGGTPDAAVNASRTPSRVVARRAPRVASCSSVAPEHASARQAPLDSGENHLHVCAASRRGNRAP